MNKRASSIVLLFLLSVLVHAQPSVSAETENSEGKESPQVLESTSFQNVDKNAAGLDSSAAKGPADVNSEEAESVPREKGKPQNKLSSHRNLPSPTAGYTIRTEAIKIISNADFTAQAILPANNWDLSGSRTGALGSPYLIAGLSITNSTHTPINITGVTTVFFEIRDSYIDAIANGQTGIYLKDTDNGVIENNTIINTNKAIQFYRADDNTIANNTIVDMSSSGVNYWSGRRNTIFNNTFDFGSAGSGSHLGIYIYGSDYTSDDNVVANNTISNAYRGMWISSGSNNLIENNTITNATYGFDLLSPGTTNTLSHNIIMNNLLYDIYITGNLNKLYDNQFGPVGVKLGSLRPRQKEVSGNLVNGRALLFLNDTIGYTNTTFNSIGQVILLNCSDIVIGFQNFSHAYQGAYIYNSDNVSIYNSTFVSNGNQGLYLESLANSTIANNTFQLRGIYLSGVFNSTVSGNTITDRISDAGIFLTSDSYNVTIDNNSINNTLIGIEVDQGFNNTITNNQISYSSYFSGRACYGIKVYYAEDTLIASNKITNGSTVYTISAGISYEGYADTQNNVTIASNILENNRRGIYVSYADNTTLFNNTVKKNAQHGIMVVSTKNFTLEDNTVVGHGDKGIYLDNSQFALVLNNTMSDNGGNGFEGNNIDNSTLLDNTMTRNGVHGLVISATRNVTIDGNTVSENAALGIQLKSITHQAFVTNNKVVNNTGPGIELNLVYNTTIFQNLITNNEVFGLSIESNSYDLFILNNSFFGNLHEAIYSASTSTGTNTIKWNDFAANNLMNSPQAYDGTLYVTWSGNFWDDWNGTGSYPIPGAGAYDSTPAVNENDPLFHYLSSNASIWVSPISADGRVYDNITIQWNTVDDSRWPINDVTYSVYASNTTGATWMLLATGLTSTAYEWNTTGVLDGDFLIRIVATSDNADGIWLTLTMPSSSTFEVDNAPFGHWITPPNMADPAPTISGNFNISWSPVTDSFDHAVNYSIYYSADNSSWTRIVANLSQSILYWEWITSTVADGQYLLKVVATDAFGAQSEDITALYFTIANAHILSNPTLTAPNGGETFTTGYVQVTWTAATDSNTSHSPIYYSIWYSTDSGTTWLQTGSNITSLYMDWYFGDFTNGAYLLKVIATDNNGLETFDVSDSSFTIQNAAGSSHTLDPPTVNSPNGGEVISGMYTISWTAAYDSDSHPITYNVYFSPDSGNTWNQIAWGEGGTSFTWDTNQFGDNSGCVIKVEADDGYGNFAEDISDNPFTIDNSGGGMSSEPPTKSDPGESEDEEPTASTPGLTMLLTLVSLIAILGFRKLKQAKKN